MPPTDHVWTVALHEAGASDVVSVAKTDPSDSTGCRHSFPGFPKVQPETDTRAQKTFKTYTELRYNGVRVPHQCQKYLDFI